MVESTTKREYTTPKVVVHGTLAEMTLQSKAFGFTDALVFMGSATVFES